MPPLVQLQKILGKGDGGWGKKGSLRQFLADQKIVSVWKKCILGHPIARATSYCLLPDTFWLRASQNAFKVGSVKFANSLSHLPLWRKYAPEVKAAMGLKRCWAKVKGVNNPAWTAQLHELHHSPTPRGPQEEIIDRLPSKRDSALLPSHFSGVQWLLV